MDQKKVGANQDQAPVTLKVLNEVINQPVIFPGEVATLDFNFTNNTGGSIGLLAGSSPSILELLICPPFAVADLSQIKLITDGWKSSVNSIDQSIVLSCTKPGEWADDSELTIKISGTSSLLPPQGSIIQVNLSGFSGSNIPLSAQSKDPLTLQNKAVGNRSLNLAIDCFLSAEGVVYVSDDPANLISNSLTLNIKNVLTRPLYSGDAPWNSTPSVLVYFVYGSTVGALAPIDPKLPPDQTALNIKAGDVQLQNNDWDFKPFNPGNNQEPQWTLTPQKDKLGILGTGESATVSFTFDGIVSLTPVGQTQVYVQFSGFPGYDDYLFVLNIDKRELPNPGVCNFYGTVSNFTIQSESDTIKLPLHWILTGVSSIKFSYLQPGLPPFSKSYGNPQPPLIQDSFVLSFNGIKFSKSLTITCEAFDENGTSLTPGQFTITIDFPPRVISYSGVLQPNGNILLAWQTVGATQVAIAFLGLQAGSSDGIQVQSPPLPLINNKSYELTASNDSGESADPVLLNRALSFGTPELIYGDVNSTKFLRDMTVSPDGHFLYITDEDNLIGININYPTFEPQISIPATSGQLQSISMAPNGQYLFATCAFGMDNVVLATIFPSQNKMEYLTQQFNAVSNPLKVSYKNQVMVFSGLQGNGNGITVMEFTDDLNWSFNSVGTGSIFAERSVAISADGKYIFTGDGISNNLLSIARPSAGQYTVLPDVPVNMLMMVASPTGPYLYCVDTFNAFAGYLHVVKINGDDSFTALSSLPILSSVQDIAISSDGNLLFVTVTLNIQSVLVLRINSDQSLQVLQTIPMSAEPDKVAVSPDGNFIFTTLTNQLCVMSATSGKAGIP